MFVFCMLLIKSRILRGQSEYHLTAPQPFNLQLSLKNGLGLMLLLASLIQRMWMPNKCVAL